MSIDLYLLRRWFKVAVYLDIIHIRAIDISTCVYYRQIALVKMYVVTGTICVIKVHIALY